MSGLSEEKRRSDPLIGVRVERAAVTSRVDAVLFDLDGTLCEYRRTGGEVLELAFGEFGIEPFFDIDAYYDRFEDAARHYDTAAEIRRHCFAELADVNGRDPDLGRDVADTYDDIRDHGAVEFVPGAEAALSAMTDRYTVGMVTNGGPVMQSQKLEALGIRDRFETIVYAGHEGRPKPSPDPFHEALSVLEAEPDRTVHVGNSLDADVQGAHAAGLDAAWFRNGDVDPDPHPDPDYVLDSMADLAEEPWN